MPLIESQIERFIIEVGGNESDTSTDENQTSSKSKSVYFIIEYLESDFDEWIFYGTISRTTKIYTLPILTKPNSVLSLLVENQGRINYGAGIHDYKGILSEVTIDRKVLNGSWSVTGFPLQNLDEVPTATDEKEQAIEGPILYDGYFTIPENKQPQDTFFDTTSWGKGYIWVNGHNLGRYWPGPGPQVTMYVPGCWLRSRNHVQVLELDQTPATTAIRSINYPILNKTLSF